MTLDYGDWVYVPVPIMGGEVGGKMRRIGFRRERARVGFRYRMRNLDAEHPSVRPDDKLPAVDRYGYFWGELAVSAYERTALRVLCHVSQAIREDGQT